VRNGHRIRVLTTTVWDLELRIPKLRTGSFFASLLERRRRINQVLFVSLVKWFGPGCRHEFRPRWG
jgi:putative transposase